MKDAAGFHLENPEAAKLMLNPEILLCAELIREFFELYKMDFSLQIFVPECNLPPQDARLREKLEGKLGIKKPTDGSNVPMLLQILQLIQKQGLVPAQKAPSDVPARNSETASTTGTIPQQVFATTKYGGFPTDEAILQYLKCLIFAIGSKTKLRSQR